MHEVYSSLKQKNDLEKYRIYYLTVFTLIIIIAIITTCLIWYFVRHKKKYYFDAAGRKYIGSTDVYEVLILKLSEIISRDDKDELEKYVISK